MSYTINLTYPKSTTFWGGGIWFCGFFFAKQNNFSPDRVFFLSKLLAKRRKRSPLTLFTLIGQPLNHMLTKWNVFRRRCSMEQLPRTTEYRRQLHVSVRHVNAVIRYYHICHRGMVCRKYTTWWLWSSGTMVLSVHRKYYSSNVMTLII